jgi:hypothetical protein
VVIYNGDASNVLPSPENYLKYSNSHSIGVSSSGFVVCTEKHETRAYGHLISSVYDASGYDMIHNLI